VGGRGSAGVCALALLPQHLHFFGVMPQRRGQVGWVLVGVVVVAEHPIFVALRMVTFRVSAPLLVV